MDCDHQERAFLSEPAPLFATAPSRRTAPSGDLAEELEALAALLAEVVELAAGNAIFPGSWELIAELAMEHESVRRAILAAL
ncbi:MAG: hypothetical protein JO287_16200 [Pseudonocardiales bacterium]|nr:hypothetical protein [Pseudonocardiales bacterium]